MWKSQAGHWMRVFDATVDVTINVSNIMLIERESETRTAVRLVDGKEVIIPMAYETLCAKLFGGE